MLSGKSAKIIGLIALAGGLLMWTYIDLVPHGVCLSVGSNFDLLWVEERCIAQIWIFCSPLCVALISVGIAILVTPPNTSLARLILVSLITVCLIVSFVWFTQYQVLSSQFEPRILQHQLAKGFGPDGAHSLAIHEALGLVIYNYGWFDLPFAIGVTIISLNTILASIRGETINIV